MRTLNRPFVGREAALSILDNATNANGPSVVHVSGPTGIGKSALLVRLADRCAERQVVHRLLDPTIDDLTQARVDDAINALAAHATASSTRAVLMIDTFERSQFPERWLASRLRAVGGSIATVLAERRPPSSSWHEANAPALRELRLSPFRGYEVEAYFDQCEIPESRREEIERFAEGNPLLLTIACERFAEGGVDERSLLLPLARSLSEGCDSRAKRFAFAVLTTAETTTGDLLLHVLDDEETADETFMWLRELSVVDETPHGLVPHPVVRRAWTVFLQAHHPSLAEAAVRAVASFRELPLRRTVNAADPVSFSLEEQDTLVKRRRSALAPVSSPPPPEVKRNGSHGMLAGDLAFDTSLRDDQFRKLLQHRLDGLAAQAGLTDREREVFQLLILGRNTNEIGSVLGITPRTAKFHQQRVLEKIGADSRVDILRLLL